MVLRAKQDNLPLPGAIASGTPMSDLTGSGDSFVTNAICVEVRAAGRFPRALTPLSGARLHSLGFDYSGGVGRAEKIEEDLRCLGILCPRHQKSMDDSGRHD